MPAPLQAVYNYLHPRVTHYVKEQYKQELEVQQELGHFSDLVRSHHYSS